MSGSDTRHSERVGRKAAAQRTEECQLLPDTGDGDKKITWDCFALYVLNAHFNGGNNERHSDQNSELQRDAAE